MIANNTSYYVDEEHQRTVSRQRQRSLDNAWIGQRIDDRSTWSEWRAQGCSAERIERRAGWLRLSRAASPPSTPAPATSSMSGFFDYTGLLG
jgi:hypothetical protein